jgi:hypothetical protein
VFYAALSESIRFVFSLVSVIFACVVSSRQFAVFVNALLPYQPRVLHDLVLQIEPGLSLHCPVRSRHVGARGQFVRCRAPEETRA